MDALTAFGVGTVGSMMVFYTLESRSPWWTLAFALSGWLAATWPFTAVELVWGLIALRKFVRRKGSAGRSAGNP